MYVCKKESVSKSDVPSRTIFSEVLGADSVFISRIIIKTGFWGATEIQDYLAGREGDLGAVSLSPSPSFHIHLFGSKDQEGGPEAEQRLSIIIIII